MKMAANFFQKWKRVATAIKLNPPATTAEPPQEKAYSKQTPQMGSTNLTSTNRWLVKWLSNLNKVIVEITRTLLKFLTPMCHKPGCWQINLMKYLTFLHGAWSR